MTAPNLYTVHYFFWQYHFDSCQLFMNTIRAQDNVNCFATNVTLNKVLILKYDMELKIKLLNVLLTYCSINPKGYVLNVIITYYYVTSLVQMSG